MESEGRTQRIAAALERQFENCQSVPRDCVAKIERQGHWGDWEVRNMLGLMKKSAQLATVIGRLDSKAPAKNHESSGSIPQ